MLRAVLSLLLLPLVALTYAQTPAELNQTDAKGKPQGEWLVRQPARMGEDAYTEWGSYDHGTRTGVWYRFDGEGAVAAIERYRLGVKDGETKYFEQGRLVCVGHYRGLNPSYAYDTIYVVDPVTDAERRVVIPTERGSVKHGLWQYYDERTGRLSREMEYSVDEIIAKQDFSIASADSAWYKKREAAKAVYPKNYYKPPAEKRHRYTDMKMK